MEQCIMWNGYWCIKTCVETKVYEFEYVWFIGRQNVPVRIRSDTATSILLCLTLSLSLLDYLEYTPHPLPTDAMMFSNHSTWNWISFVLTGVENFTTKYNCVLH